MVRKLSFEGRIKKWKHEVFFLLSIHFAKQLGEAASLTAFDTRSLFSSCCVVRGALRTKENPDKDTEKEKHICSRLGITLLILTFGR